LVVGEPSVAAVQSDILTEIAEISLEAVEDFVHAGGFVFREEHGHLTVLELGVDLQGVAQGGRDEGIPFAKV
jgi:hypothetical protein